MSDDLAPIAPVRVLQLYFRVRPPWKLAADGVLCFVAYALFSHLWVAFADSGAYDDRARPAANLLAALTRPATVMQSISNTLFYIGAAVFAWGCVRLIAEALRAREPS